MKEQIKEIRDFVFYNNEDVIDEDVQRHLDVLDKVQGLIISEQMAADLLDMAMYCKEQQESSNGEIEIFSHGQGVDYTAVIEQLQRMRG